MDAQMGATGIEVSFTEFLPPGKILFLSGAPVAADLRFSLRPEQERYWWAEDAGDSSWLKMHASCTPKMKTLRRPSWLHPFRRILWVHHHGPHLPTVEVPVIDFNSYGVIEGID